jgi:uncharacterized secreted protein with C-terminal beta-propeller domain
MRKPAVLLTGFAVLGAVAVVGAVAAGGTAPVRLQQFRSCAGLVEYAKANASKLAGAGPIASPPGVVAAPAGAPAGLTRAADHSATNVQEAGVDEPDTVKTDGSHIFAVAANKVYAVDTRGARPRLLGSLDLGQGFGHQLLLHEGRLLVLSSSGSIVVPAAGRMGILPSLPTKTVLSEIDVRDPASMKLVRTLTIDGAYLAARLVGATARVVIASTPTFPPPEGATPNAKSGAEPSRAAVASSSVRNWLPTAVLQDRRTGRRSTRPLVQCRDVRYPPVFSGLGVLTVVTVDLDRGLPPVDSDAVMMGSGTVYASANSLYVATQRFLPVPLAAGGAPPTGATTEIHKFDISQRDRTDYRASGAVPGFLFSQWSLSEYKGDLRVASTELPLWWNPTSPRESESFVSVLAERSGRLVELGSVGGLGRGERVYAVRFIGDAGFVVTFRQVDPLYTIDLHNPAEPTVLGTLELRGYSAYLHPVGNDLLLGVGQDATQEGRVLGTQLSLFDISNLRAPTRLDAAALGPGSSEVEYDPHAFLFWPAKALAVLPVQTVTPAKGPFVGALAFRVSRKGIQELGRIVHPGVPGQAAAPVRRSVVVGGRLYTTSDLGVKVSSLATLADVAWIPFA